MNIAVVGGCGYVGLITCLGFARLGHQVAGIDSDVEKVALHSAGHSHIYEPDIETSLADALESGKLNFLTDLDEGISDAEVIFVAVGSPRGEDGAADVSQIESVARDLATAARPGTVIVIKSTVPVGTEALMREFLLTEDSESVTELVVNPEFLREGSGLYDFFHPDRIVVGGGSDRARQVLRDLYAPFLGSSQIDASRP